MFKKLTRTDVDFSLGDYLSSGYWTSEMIKRKEIASNYVIFDNENKRELLAISEKYLSDELFHYGVLQIYDNENNLVFDNEKNLEELGLFGNSNIKSPTYLMRKNFNPNIIYVSWNNPNKRVLVRVNTKKLLEKRSVFLDPSSLIDKYFEKEYENSFLIMGGIPKDAIISIEKCK